MSGGNLVQKHKKLIVKQKDFSREFKHFLLLIHWLEMSAPPHCEGKPSILRSISTCQGHEWALAGIPLLIK